MGREKTYTQDEALALIWDKIKPEFIDKKTYHKFRQYKYRYDKGQLGDRAIETILTYFGFEKHVHYTK